MTNSDIKAIKFLWHERGTLPINLENIEGASQISKAYNEMMAWERYITSLVDSLNETPLTEEFIDIGKDSVTKVVNIELDHDQARRSQEAS